MAFGAPSPRLIRKLADVYLPKHFAARDQAAVEAFVDGAGAADLVTFDGTKPVASLIPIIWERPAGAPDGSGTGENGHGRLLGHLALANPQWRSAGPETVALAIVHGPQAYISPSWYPSTARHGKVVPTWNYVSVHITGRLTVHRDPESIRDVVTRLTARHEAAGRHPGGSATRPVTSSTASCGPSSGSSWRSRPWRPRKS